MNKQQIELRIDGMSCPSCGRHVAHALESVPGVEKVMVPGWQSARATVIADDSVPTAALLDAVAAAGYTAMVRDQQPTQRPTEGVSVHTGSDNDFDLMVIGGGSGGFAAAIAVS